MTPALWKHQEKAITLARTKRDLALFFEPGTGKTRTTIEILREKYLATGQVRPTLILGPVIVVQQWAREFGKYSKIPADKIVTLQGPGAKRLAKFEKAREYCPGFIAISNYEALLMADLHRALMAWKPECLVLDESHRAKGYNTKRAKLLNPLADFAKHRYLLTGTPVLNSPMDLYQQYRLLDLGKSFGLNFYAFRAQYFFDANAGMPAQRHFPNWVARKDAYPRFQAVIEETSVQAKKSECLDLPPLVRTEIPVELSAEQKKAYEDMKRDSLVFFRNQAVSANMALTKALRLQQIVAGFLQPDAEMGEDPEPAIVFGNNPRLTALMDLLEDLLEAEHQILIWTNFRATYKMIGNALTKAGISHGFLTGDQTTKQKEDAVAEFNQGKLKILVGNPAAAGLGLNLDKAKSAIWYSRGYSLEFQLQAIARNYRGGSEQHDKVTHYELVAPGTLDETIMRALATKENVAEQVLAWAGEN